MALSKIWSYIILFSILVAGFHYITGDKNIFNDLVTGEKLKEGKEFTKVNYFIADKKHGKGAYFYNNNSYMISMFKDNNPFGLSIFYSEDKGEQIVYMEGNKVIKSLNDPNEILNVKDTFEYEELVKYYQSGTKCEIM